MNVEWSSASCINPWQCSSTFGGTGRHRSLGWRETKQLNLGGSQLSSLPELSLCPVVPHKRPTPRPSPPAAPLRLPALAGAPLAVGGVGHSSPCSCHQGARPGPARPGPAGLTRLALWECMVDVWFRQATGQRLVLSLCVLVPPQLLFTTAHFLPVYWGIQSGAVCWHRALCSWRRPLLLVLLLQLLMLLLHWLWQVAQQTSCIWLTPG